MPTQLRVSYVYRHTKGHNHERRETGGGGAGLQVTHVCFQGTASNIGLQFV